MRHNNSNQLFFILVLFFNFSACHLNRPVIIEPDETDLKPVHLRVEWLKRNLNILLYKKYGIKSSEFLLVGLFYRAAISEKTRTLYIGLHPIWLKNPADKENTKVDASSLFCVALNVESEYRPVLKSVFLKKEEREKIIWKKFSGDRLVLFQKDKLVSGSLPVSVYLTLDPKTEKIFPGVYSDLPGDTPTLMITYTAADAKIITGLANILRNHPDDDKPFGFFNRDVWEELSIQSPVTKNDYFNFEMIPGNSTISIWPP